MRLVKRCVPKWIGIGDMEGAYDKDQANVFCSGPLQRVFVLFEGRIPGSVAIFLRAREGSALLDEYVGDEAVDDIRVDWRIRLLPQHDARRGQDLESVQHVCRIDSGSILGQH